MFHVSWKERSTQNEHNATSKSPTKSREVPDSTRLPLYSTTKNIAQKQPTMTLIQDRISILFKVVFRMGCIFSTKKV